MTPELIAKYAKTPVHGSETPDSKRPRTLAEMASLAPDELFAGYLRFYAALILILFFGAFNQSQQFIYFQF